MQIFVSFFYFDRISMEIKFAENLKRLRKSKGISQDNLSIELGLSRGAVSQYESDRNFPNMETMIKLCEIFHVSLDELILGNSSKIGSHPTVVTSTIQQPPQESNQHHLQKEIEYLTKTVAMQEREINTMRSYTARLEKELEKCEESLENGHKTPRQTG